MSEKKVPKLRFPEFSECWENSILNSIAKFSKGKGISKSDIIIDGETYCIRYGELYTHYNEVIRDVYSKTNVNKSELVFSEYNDVIIPASGETQIDIATASCVLKDGVALGGDLNIIKSILNGVYLSYYLNAVKKLEIASLSQGNSVVHLYATQLQQLNINYPSSKEQTKIANFLTSVDDKIQQLTKKKELLEHYKKGVMRDIFSQKIRFKDDNGQDYPDWRYEHLKEYLVKHEEKSLYHDQYPVLTSSRKGLYFQKDYFDGQDVASKDTTGYNVVPRNFFTYRHMSDDLVFSFNRNTIVDKGIVSTLYPVFTTQNIDDKFLEIKLNMGIEFKEFAIQQKQGGSRTYMYFSKLQALMIWFPIIKEQAKIANFLTNIDDKITQVNTQLEQTKLFKKSLLQQMFI
jgi:type I restriction enzyme S subunit